MTDHSNIPEAGEKSPKKTKNKTGRVILWAIIAFLFLIAFYLSLFLFRHPTVAKAAYNFVMVPVGQVSSNNNRINILLMGKSGADHEGADLTDTMILVSLSLDGQGAKTVSIPRDIWMPDIMAKINSAYYWGKNGSAYFSLQDTGGGISFAKRIVGKIIGQPIQYGIVIDFSAFKDIIDAIGGISVDVDRPFVDNYYPIAGRENDTCDGDKTYMCRYETVIFDSGIQTMDGEKALKFVRSRHAEGDEGTDISRETRQQKVIEAIKNKVTEPKTYLSIKRILAILLVVNKYVETDIDFPTAGIIARKALENMSGVSQEKFPEDLIKVPSTSDIYNNLYVFVPVAGNGNWEEIQKWFSENF